MMKDYLKNKTTDTIRVNSAMTKFKESILIMLGIFFTGIGIIGIFLPLLPTTVFFLLAAACFAHSSKKFYDWLINNKWFGTYIKNYRDKKGISIKVKIYSVSLLWITILSSAIFMIDGIWVRVGLISIAIAVTIHILTLRTFKEKHEILMMFKE